MLKKSKGKGYKACPACEKYVGVRTGQCGCGHAFMPSGKAGKASKTGKVVNRGKIGYKACPACEKYVGVRTRQCECGQEFMPKIDSWKNCARVMLALLRGCRQGYTLVEIATRRLTKTHSGCPTAKCKLTNKQLQQLLMELVKNGQVKKEGMKYKSV